MSTQFILDRHTDLTVSRIQALTALLAGAGMLLSKEQSRTRCRMPTSG